MLTQIYRSNGTAKPAKELYGRQRCRFAATIRLLFGPAAFLSPGRKRASARCIVSTHLPADSYGPETLLELLQAALRRLMLWRIRVMRRQLLPPTENECMPFSQTVTWDVLTLTERVSGPKVSVYPTAHTGMLPLLQCIRTCY